MRLRLRLKYFQATPTLAIQSTLGAAPLVLSVSDTSNVIGRFGQLQIDQTSNAFSNITQNILFIIDASNIANLDEVIGLTTPPGLYYARFRIVQDNDNGATTVTGNEWNGQSSNSVSFSADVSAWSNIVTDTIVSSAAVLSTVTGVNKNSATSISGTPALIFNCTSGNGANTVRTSLEQASDYAQYEITITSGDTGNILVGFDDGTLNLNGNVIPGYTSSTGICLQLSGGAQLQLLWNSAGNTSTLVNTAGTIANGDIFTVVFKKSANQIEVYRTRSGVTTQMGSTLTTMPTLTHYYGYAGSNNATCQGTMNFGASTYAKTPGSGVASIWA